MQFSVYRLNVTYEVGFKEPAFEIARSPVPILTAFHQRLHPRFGLRLSDLQVLGGTAMSDVRIRIALFNGQGSLEVAADKFSCSFEGLRIWQDATLVKDCIALSEEALAEALPELNAKTTAIKTSSWLICDGGEMAVKEVLGRFGDSAICMANAKLGATNISHSLRSQFQNESERWSVAFGLERSLVEGSDLFVMCDGTYSDGGLYAGLDERTEHLQGLYLGILEQFGLEPRPSTGES